MKESIHNFRKALGLSMSQLGKLLGVSPATIYNWERGTSMPQLLHTFRIKALVDDIEARHWGYSEKQQKFYEDYCNCPHPEEARQSLGFSREKFAEILGCTLSEYHSWVGGGVSVPLHHKRFIKFLVQAKGDGKL